MEPRMKNPAAVLPGGWQAVAALAEITKTGGLPESTLALVHLRASQINGCGSCLDGGAKQALKAGETPERLATVAAWRETPYFTDAERAALALTEAATRLADSPDPVPDEIWDEAVRHYDEQGMAALVLAIAVVNVFNRLNRVTRQQAGAW
jgi:AhpD family alkylhydroperoxidase